MLQIEGRTSDTDVSLDQKKKSSKKLARSVYDSPIDDTEKEKEKLVSMLTAREADLYYLLLEGYTLKEAAKELSVKYSTANTHMTAIYKKLKVNSRAELIIKYRAIGRSV
jgi:DNA-binding CsgD family transcriptional regulator